MSWIWNASTLHSCMECLFTRWRHYLGRKDLTGRSRSLGTDLWALHLFLGPMLLSLLCGSSWHEQILPHVAPPCLPHNGRLTPLRLILHVGVFFLMLLPLWNLPQWPQRTNTLGLQNVTWKIIKFLTGDSSLWTAGDVKRKRLTWEDNDLQRLEFFFLF